MLASKVRQALSLSCTVAVMHCRCQSLLWLLSPTTHPTPSRTPPAPHPPHPVDPRLRLLPSDRAGQKEQLRAELQNHGAGAADAATRWGGERVICVCVCVRVCVCLVRVLSVRLMLCLCGVGYFVFGRIGCVWFDGGRR